MRSNKILSKKSKNREIRQIIRAFRLCILNHRKPVLLEPATELVFCKKTLGKRPVVEDDGRVGTGVQTSDWAKRAHLRSNLSQSFENKLSLSYFRSKVLFRAIAREERVGANKWEVWRTRREEGGAGV